MDFDITVVERIVPVQGIMDNLVILNIDVLMVIGGVKADVHAPGADVVDIELVATQVKIAGQATVCTGALVGKQREHHVANGCGVFGFALIAPLNLKALINHGISESEKMLSQSLNLNILHCVYFILCYPKFSHYFFLRKSHPIIICLPFKCKNKVFCIFEFFYKVLIFFRRHDY